MLRSRVKVFHCALLAAGQHVGFLLMQKLRGEAAAGDPSVQRQLEAVKEATARMRFMGCDCVANATTLFTNITSELRRALPVYNVCVVRRRVVPHCVAARRRIHCCGSGSMMGACSAIYYILPPSLTVLVTCLLGPTPCLSPRLLPAEADASSSGGKVGQSLRAATTALESEGAKAAAMVWVKEAQVQMGR